MRYFLQLAYDGAPFHGWQSQPNAISVQETVENALTTILREKVALTGAGRTDTGVNARCMYAHFDSTKPLIYKEKFLLSLNRLVGKDIFIKDIFSVGLERHARFDAKKRTYKYFITNKKNPFLKDFFWISPSHLDFEAMNRNSKKLLEVSDFTSFAKLHSDVKTNFCKVSEAIWRPLEEDLEAKKFIGSLNDSWVFTITADRFLRNMVRAIVGTLVDIGRHKIDDKKFLEIINERNRCSAGTSMPPHALFLWDIKYPFVNLC